MTQVGKAEVRPNFRRYEPKEAAGVPMHHAADTAKGAAQSFSRNKAKFLCFKCGSLKSVVSVQTITQHEESEDYDCTLSCTHRRRICMSVARTPSGKRALKMSEEKAERARQKLEEQQAVETAEIRGEMHDARLDG